MFSVTGQKCPSQQWLNDAAHVLKNSGKLFFLIISLIDGLAIVFFFLPTKWVKLMFLDDCSLCQDREKEEKKVYNAALQCHQLGQGYQRKAERQHIKGLFNCWLIVERRVWHYHGESVMSRLCSRGRLGARGGAGEPSRSLTTVPTVCLMTVSPFLSLDCCRAHQQRAGEPLWQPPGGHCWGTHVRTVHRRRFLRKLHRFSLREHQRHRRYFFFFFLFF